MMGAKGGSRPGWDVIVVGAGPAGSVSAGLLAEHGHRVLLLERSRHPRPKPCGEFINPGAIAALERTGFASEVAATDPARIEGWRIRTWEGADIAAPFGAGGGTHPLIGWGVARMRFDEALARGAVDRGVVLDDLRTVIGVSRDAEGVSVESRRGGVSRTDRARFLVVADGLRSRTLRLLGVRARAGTRPRVSLTAHLEGIDLTPDRGRLHLGGLRTVGLAPLDPAGNRWNATVVAAPDLSASAIRADPTGFLLDMVRAADVGRGSTPRCVAGPWGSGAFDLRTSAQTGPFWAAVGDAAGYFDPLTGQGVHQALRSAELVASHLHAALRRGDSSRGLPAYQRRLRRELAAVRRVQRLVATVVEHPRLGRAVFPRLERAPESASALVRVTGDHDPARALLGPSVWVPLLRPSRHHGRSPTDPSRSRNDSLARNARP